jgi:4-alpha-glucanotransferase
VVYPGTHDNDTVVGWHRSLPTAVKRRFAAYSGDDAARDPAAAMTRLAFTSPANTAIVQMQDLLGLGRRARMNIPGKPTGNWSWRLRRTDLDRSTAADLRMLTAATGR